MKLRRAISAGSTAAGLGLALLAGCVAGPDYHRPAALQTPMPERFARAASSNAVPWKIAQPSAHQPRGAWWQAFQDPELDRLENLAAGANQDLKAAVARFAQARAFFHVARSDLFPQSSASPSVTRQGTSSHQFVPAGAKAQNYTYSEFTVAFESSWELDLWGRVRRAAESARAQEAASADDLESLKLATAAEIAADYFTLSGLKQERDLLEQTLEAYQRALELTRNRRKGGIASDLDVSQAETQLKALAGQLPDNDLKQANLRDALAALCGHPATGFEVRPAPLRLDAAAPTPLSTPSELLERRPDIAAAERRMAAANAQVGVAKAAFYPRVVIHGLAGLQSVDASTLFDWPSRLWAVGPSIDWPLFTGGRIAAQLAAARAAYDETVARYRQVVLGAFQEVEDQLAAQQFLGAQLESGLAAMTSARRTLEIANNRYKAGLVTYLEVASAQTTALDQQRQVVRLRSERLAAAVALAKAVGGGWTATASE